MSVVVIAGLCLLAGGGLLWLLSAPMARVGASRRSLLIVRFVATAWLAMGAGLIIYAITQGK
ncbi:hypothetical protein SAMN04489743_1112 [Pseudarthrobacter equi]|uniref:Uncharacterized protein n=1 Tax=Pseudarthrobacter equi TaxID=728066 RepID=A0A1H1VUF2_9MICC|nr:hypothetical protein [Pseudarthrobacter equi]SDS88392.1 hypothetical protein SAMN04489743_1112 [Pseudarthrobacter equi]